jgi:hypothetical protein
MTTLIFFITVLVLLILFIRIIVKLIRRKPVTVTIKIILAIILAYSALWIIFGLTRKRMPVPMGTEICFDDWCATVSKSTVSTVGDSMQVVLTITMSNHARGIAQKPSEPRVHILDTYGHAWPYSLVSQQAYEKKYGSQPGIGHRLEIHQTMETVMVFELPKRSVGLRALIEEGPWITHLLFPEDQMIFKIGN